MRNIILQLSVFFAALVSHLAFRTYSAIAKYPPHHTTAASESAAERFTKLVSFDMSAPAPVSYYANKNMDTLNSIANLSSNDQIVVILCGIPGCGKSTYARALVSALPLAYRKKWDVSNQDTLGTRQKVLAHASAALRAKKSVVIDRCNFDAEQRAHWVNLARASNVAALYCVIMPDYDNTKLCTARALERGNRDGVHGDDVNWAAVCHGMKQSFRLPTMDEGFSGIFTCNNLHDLVCFANSLKDIADR